MNRKQNNDSSGYELGTQRPTYLTTLANRSLIQPFSPGQPVTKQEKWIYQEWRNRMAVEQAISIETQYAHDAMAFLYLHGYSVFQKAAHQIMEIKNSTEAEELRPYMDKYCTRTLEDLATRQFGLNDVATANIAYTIHRDHYPPDIKDEPKSWLRRLLGGNEE